MLSQAYVKRLFDYDPLTGVVTWRMRKAKHTHIGQRAGTPHYTNTGKPAGRFINIDYQLYAEAKVIWLWMTGKWPSNDIDHADVNADNNVWSNLREATHSQNSANKPNRKSKHLKWTQPIGNKFSSKITVNYVQHYVGIFNTEQEAHDAAWKLAQKLHGAFARR